MFLGSHEKAESCMYAVCSEIASLNLGARFALCGAR